MTDVYVSLEKLVSNWANSNRLQSEIRNEGILTRVTLWHASIPRSRLELSIYFKDGEHSHTISYVNVENIEAIALIVPALLDASRHIIARHEYHERMKASNPDGK
jgi:hypothetical protein